MTTLRKGSKGEEVLILKGWLNALDTADYFGDETDEAVRFFQQTKGLKVDGIVGPETWKALTGGNEPSGGAFSQPVDYKQYDSRWAKVMYSNHKDKSQTIKSSGCGPTSMADIVATVKDKNITPVEMAEFSLEKGCRTDNSGTAWSFFPKVADEYGFSRYKKCTSLADLKDCLSTGGYIVASMGKGYWTSGGHYICVWKYDDTYIYANDPASSTRKKQKISDFMSQRKAFFCFWA